MGVEICRCRPVPLLDGPLTIALLGALAVATPFYEPGPVEVVLAPDETRDDVALRFERRAFRGLEADIWVHSDAGRWPVTVKVDDEGAVDVQHGDGELVRQRPPNGLGAEQWRARIASEFRLLRVEDGDAAWTEDDLGLVVAALSRLNADEAAVLDGLIVRRDHFGRRWGDVAEYDSQQRVPHIALFDWALEVDRWNFVGSPSAPVPASVQSLVHEVGHAFADAPRRELQLQWEALYDVDATLMSDHELEDWYDDRKALMRRTRSLGRRGPVLDAYREAIRGGPRGPTRYGRRNVHESFAEAFGLYKTDPRALGRVMPLALVWFESGGHIVALDTWRSPIP